jgi:hypothetical protein
MEKKDDKVQAEGPEKAQAVPDTSKVSRPLQEPHKGVQRVGGGEIKRPVTIHSKTMAQPQEDASVRRVSKADFAATKKLEDDEHGA